MRTETIKVEMTASLNGKAEFVHAKTWFNRPYPNCIGVVTVDIPGCATTVVARFKHIAVDQWMPLEITPFVRRAVARERGHVGPVYV